MLWDVPKLVPPLADLVFRSPHQTSRTRLATHSVDAPCVGPTTKTPAYLVLRNSTATDLAVARLPRQWPGARSALACASVPTDDGAAISRADPEAPLKAARSTESGFPPAASESNPHLADHVSASVARPPVCFAGWPTWHSIPNSSIRFRNHCIDPVASIPTRTGRGRLE